MPALFILMGAGCQQQDSQLQARLADAEARAKLAEAAADKWKQSAAELQKKVQENGGGNGGSSEALAELKQENEGLREKLAKVSSAGPAGFGMDLEAIEKAFTEGVRERRKEWKVALSDYKVLSYETPEVSPEDVKPFRTNLAIKLEQAGRTFTAYVPVSADFQGNWSFPSPAEVLGHAKEAQQGRAQAATPAAPPNPAGNPPSQPVVSAGGTPPQPQKPVVPPDSTPEMFNGKVVQKLPSIKFPGDP